MSEYRIKSALEIMAERSTNHFHWIDEARQLNGERSFFKKVLGMDKVDAEDMMLQEAHEMRLDRECIPPQSLVGTLQYEIRTRGRTRPPTVMRGELRGNPDDARRFAHDHVLSIESRDSFVRVDNANVYLPDGSTTSWQEFVQPVIDLQRK